MKGTSSLVFIFLISNICAYPDEWAKFKREFGRVYESAMEERMRYSIFQENVRIIESHNREYLAGKHSFYMGINQFSDMHAKELAHSSFVRHRNISGSTKTMEISTTIDVPESLDWRAKGAVTPVGNQLGCGSCYLFATLGSLESQYFLRSGKLVNLSVQQILDCSSVANCYGGYPEWILEEIRRHGVVLAEDYPAYDAHKHQCRANGTLFKGIGVTSFPISENAIKNAVATFGPLAANFDSTGFEKYAGGVYYNPNCSSTLLDHVVLIVGYGTEDGQDYWLVKNSWGESWGENGFAKVSRNRNNNCGIVSDVLSAYLHS